MCLPMISRLLLEYSIDLSHIARSLYALIELARAPGPVVFGRGEEMERERAKLHQDSLNVLQSLFNRT